MHCTRKKSRSIGAVCWKTTSARLCALCERMGYEKMATPSIYVARGRMLDNQKTPNMETAAGWIKEVAHLDPSSHSRHLLL